MTASRPRERKPFISSWYGRALFACGLAFLPYGYVLLWSPPPEPEDSSGDRAVTASQGD
jgi:hypothetical protein